MTISYQKGITTSPSDFLCENGELAECINLAVDNEEIKVLTPAMKVMDLAGALLFVHAIDNEKNYIYKNGSYLYFKRGINGSGTSTGIGIFDDVKDIKSIGKTLIIECGTATYYAVWNGTNYDNYNKLPTPEVNFWLEEGEARKVEQKDDSAMDREGTIDTEKQDLYNNIVTGFYAKLKKEAGAKNQFLNPFFACAALELFDGSYTRITNPVLLFPSVTGNHALYNMPEKLSMRIFPATLHASLTNADKYNYRYSDIVKSIVIFVSDEIDLCDTSGDQNYIHVPYTVIIDNIWNKTYQVKERALPPAERIIYNSGSGVNYRAVDDVKGNISSTSVFYKLCSLSLANGETNLSASAPAHTVENITTQQQLPLDYHSNSEVFSEKMYTYNNRLNLISPKRTFFEGFKHFVSYGTTPHTFTFEVEIQTQEGTKYATKTFTSSDFPDIWFYYPDPRAKTVRIYDEDYYLIKELTLKEHTGLNGAYYFKGIPTGNEYYPTGTTSGSPHNTSASETLYNQIATSEVNNPWVFKAEGYNSVGSGSVMAVATQTQALSQGQFGQYPLIVFATDGIWAMDVNNTGLYQRVSPISRDVLTNENAIVETDNAVFFPTEKGLFVIAGSTVREMSRLFCGRKVDVMQLPSNVSGQSEEGRVKTTSHTDGFRAFVNDGNTLAVYDYVNSRICFLNTGMDAAYAYHIYSGTLSQWFPEIPRSGILRVVRDYPHSLIAISTGSAYYPHNDEADAGNDHYAGYMLTRPVKFGEPLTVHSLREMKHVGYWNEADGSSVRMELLMSDDMINWYLAGSRFGAAAKYWRWALYVCMTPQERLSGTVVRTQQRRDNNLR